MKENPTSTTSLRSRVMKFLEENSNASIATPEVSPEKLIEELHIHQIELEMQNEDLRLAHENAKQIQAKYIDLYESAPVGYLTLGKNLKIVEINQTASQLLGVAKPQILYHPFTDFVVQAFQDVLYFHIAKVRKSKSHESCELKLKRQDKKPFFAYLESMAVCNEAGVNTDIRISFIDIHEKKMNELALKESADRNEMLLNLLPHSAFLIDHERKVIVANQMAKNIGVKVGEVCQKEELAKNSFESTGRDNFQGTYHLIDENTYRERLFTVIDDSNDAIYLMDLQGNIKAWNRMAEKMYGYSAAEAMKMSVFDLVPVRLKKQTVQLLSDVRAGVMVKPFETRRIAKDGNILDIYLTITRMVQNGKIVAITTTERDITTHNRLFASLQQLPRRIIIAQEEERSRISQILHSEVGQALTALKLFIVITSSDLPENDHLMRSVFDKVRTQLDTIIDDTRTLAHKLSPPGLKYAGLIPAIKELVKSAITEELHIQFFHNGIDQACFKKKDIIIYRILQEALQNIQKHSKATWARVSIVLKKTVFILEIRDNGIGFNPSLQSKGLGLALMRHQAALINGDLYIESHEKRGTLLKVRIPIKEKRTT